MDGQKSDLSGDGGQCAMTYIKQRTSEWRVDLGGVRHIHHIFIQYRTENAPWRTSYFPNNNFFIKFPFSAVNELPKMKFMSNSGNH